MKGECEGGKLRRSEGGTREEEDGKVEGGEREGGTLQQHHTQSKIPEFIPAPSTDYSIPPFSNSLLSLPLPLPTHALLYIPPRVVCMHKGYRLVFQVIDLSHHLQ